MAWIIDFRGDMSETSELNMDGSDSIRAIAVVYGDELPVVLTNFFAYLKNNEITPALVLSCHQLRSGSIPDHSLASPDTFDAALRRISSENPIALAYGISSEAEKNKKITEL